MKHILHSSGSGKTFLVLLVAVHLLYFICVICGGNIYTPDSQEYLQSAVNLQQYGELYNYFWTANKIPEYYSLRPPVYGIFIMLLKFVYPSDLVVLFIQNMLSIFVWILLVRLTKDFPAVQAKLRVLIILTLILFPTHLIIVNSIMADLLLQFWLVTALFFLICFLERKTSGYILLYNVALTVAVFTKPVMLYFWIPNLVFSFYLFAKKRNVWVLLTPLLMPLLIYVWNLRNEALTGYFHFSSIQSQNMLGLNAGGVLTFMKDETYSKQVQKDIIQQASASGNYKEKNEKVLAASFTIMEDNWFIYSYTHIRGMLNFMLSTGRVDILNFSPSMQTEDEISIIREFEKSGLSGLSHYLAHVQIGLLIYMFFIFLWNAILLLAFILFYFNASLDKGIKAFICMLIVYVCVVCGSAGYARLKMSILPLMVLSAAFVWQYWQDKNKKPLVVAFYNEK